MKAVAQAIGRKVSTSSELESAIRSHFGEHVTEHHLKMAFVPDGPEVCLETLPSIRTPCAALYSRPALARSPDRYDPAQAARWEAVAVSTRAVPERIYITGSSKCG